MSKHLRRGFKKEADEYAKELRAELGLRPDAPLSPWQLAQHLEIPIRPLSTLRDKEPASVAHLFAEGRREFSATTLSLGTHRIIVHNDAHSRERQASNIAHELAHCILGHPCTPPLSDVGCRNYDPVLEAEANWLGPALLVSREAALKISWQGQSAEEAARQYGVTKEVMLMRLGVTGALKIVSRSRTLRKEPARPSWSRLPR